MRFLYRKIPLQLYSLSYLTLWSSTSFAAYIQEAADNWWDIGPSTELDKSIHELFPELSQHPLSSSWASEPKDPRTAREIELPNYHQHFTFQPTLTGKDIRESVQASPSPSTVPGPILPDSQVDNRRIDEEVGSRKRAKYRHGDVFSSQEPTTSSTLKPDSTYDPQGVNTLKPDSSYYPQGVNAGKEPILYKEAIRITPTHGQPLVQNGLISTRETEVNQGQFPPLDLMSLIITIREYYSRAYGRLEQFNSLPETRFQWINVHPEIPLIYKPSTGDSGPSIIRIASDIQRRIPQRLETLMLLYKKLLIEIYRSALQRLHPITERTIHDEVRKIFEWLDQEIFNPENGVPLLATNCRAAKGWKEDFSETQWGKTQEELARFFSDEQRAHAQITSFAPHLIGSYHDVDRVTKETALKKQRKPPKKEESLLDVPDSVYFSERYQFIFNLPSDEKLSESFIDQSDQFRQRYQSHPVGFDVVKSTILDFEKRIRRSQKLVGGHGHNLAVKHKFLQIGLVQEGKGETYSMRVLKPSSNEVMSPYSVDEFLMVYKKLTTAVELLHLLILKRLDISIEEIKERRTKVIQWIGLQTTKPRKGCPAFGQMKRGTDYPALKGRMLAGDRLFGAVQLSAIHYFSRSTDSNFSESKPTAAFLLAIWYQTYHRKDFEGFFTDQKLRKI